MIRMTKRLRLPKLHKIENRRAFLGFSLGLMLALALIPHNLILVLPIVFSIYVYTLWNISTPKEAFSFGFSFGFVHYSVTIGWISKSFFNVDMKLLAIPAMILLISYYSLYLALINYIACYIKKKLVNENAMMQDYGYIGFILLFSSLWSLNELQNIFNPWGLPWNPLASIWINYLPILQAVSIFGQVGLGLITVIVASLPSILIANSKKQYKKYLWSGSIFLVIIILLGLLRLHNANPISDSYYKNKIVRIVQPNIPQKEKWNRKYMIENLKKILNLIKGTNINDDNDKVPLELIKEKNIRVSDKNPDLIIAPESAITYSIENNSTQKLLQRFIPQDSKLIIGSVYQKDQNTHYNSSYFIDDHAKIIHRVDKYRLVPFGEYTPLSDILPFSKAIHLNDIKAAPHKPTPIQFSGLNILPLICFEIAFGDLAITSKNRPDIILTITNDAWFNGTNMFQQHKALSVLRAIEFGTTAVSVANTGISSIIDGYGRTWLELPNKYSGFIDTVIPKKLSKTIYEQYGNLLIPSIMILLCFIIAIINMLLSKNCPNAIKKYYKHYEEHSKKKKLHKSSATTSYHKDTLQ